jgi:2-amino-4-hydroxy-6-hydroxymethyldihydropteridine diphosphokinase
MIMSRVILGLGSNIGDRQKNLKTAIDEIGKKIGKVISLSSIYETEPWGFDTDNQFLNMVLIAETTLSPSGVLGRILMIEAEMGRIRTEKQYSSRIIDIDILFFDDLILDELSLKIPHPLLHERRFVLEPLSEITPEYIHPVFRESISTLLSHCTDNSNVKKPFPL